MTSRQNRHRPSGEETTARRLAVAAADPCEAMGQLGATPTPTGAASTRGRRSIGLAPEPQHTHLDQQRRPRGVCPGCDALWDWQQQRVGDDNPGRGVGAHDSADRNRRRALWQLGGRRYGGRQR